MKVSWVWLLGLSLGAGGARGQIAQTDWGARPYRALLVVERWSDPASVLVDHEKDDFQPIAALLKAWSIPFDIFRLDQQHLDASYLFDRSGNVRYGVVIWLADLPSYENQNLASLEEAAHRGTSLLAIRSRFLDPTLERLLGLKFKESYRAPDPLRVTHAHFITRELLAQKMDSLDISEASWTGLWVEPRGSEVLIAQGPAPGGRPTWLAKRRRVAGTRNSGTSDAISKFPLSCNCFICNGRLTI
jgi:hypothetical protein